MFAAIGLVFGFIIIEDPEKYLGDLNHPVDGEVDVAGHDVVEAADNSTTLAESAQVSAGEVGGSLETQHYQHLVRTVQNKGVERKDVGGKDIDSVQSLIVMSWQWSSDR